MRRLLGVLVLVAGCQDSSAPLEELPLLELSAQSPGESAPPDDCAVEGAACDTGSTMCAVRGTCYRGRCVSAGKGELPPGPRASFEGSFHGVLSEDGAAFAGWRGSDAELVGFGSREDTAGVTVQMAANGIGYGLTNGAVTALDLATKSILWTSPTPGADRFLVADTGQGVLAVSADALHFVSVADGALLRSESLPGSVSALSADETGRVFARSYDGTCHLSAFRHDGTPEWSHETECRHVSDLPAFAGRVFDGNQVRDAETGLLIKELDDVIVVDLVSEDVIVATQRGGSFVLYDPDSLTLTRRVAGGGYPVGLTARGTLLSGVVEWVSVGRACPQDCDWPTGELREYSLDGTLLGACRPASTPEGAVFGNGVVWVSYDSTGGWGYTGYPLPGYEPAAKGWVVPRGTPGAQRRPR